MLNGEMEGFLVPLQYGRGIYRTLPSTLRWMP